MQAKKGIASINRGRQFFIVAMLFIPITSWLFFFFTINSSTLLMAFKDNTGAWSLDNAFEVWEYLTDENGGLKISLINTCKYFFCGEFIGVPLSLGTSYFLYKKVFGYKAFRIIFYLPSIIPTMVYVSAFSQFVAPFGPLEQICDALKITLPETGLLYTSETATPTMIFYTIWLSACGNLLFYSAMSRIPPELIEYGKLEGITLRKEFVHIILPLIWETFSVTLLIDFTGILNAGGPVLLFGNTAHRTSTLNYWFFSRVYNGGVSGLGTYGVMSFAGLVFTGISVPVTLIVRRFLNKKSGVEY